MYVKPRDLSVAGLAAWGGTSAHDGRGMSETLGGAGELNRCYLLSTVCSLSGRMPTPNSSPDPPSPSTHRETHQFCSQHARAAGAQVPGTAAVASAWLLIEVPAPWSRKVLRDNGLPKAVQKQLRAWDDTHGRLRIQFIRRRVNTRDRDGHIAAYFAYLTAQERRCYTVSCRQYEAVLDWDVPAWVQGATPAEAAEVDTPLYFTCTNGKRDACCAKWGRTLHDAMHAAAPAQAWQTTHLGGHRFAPTLLTLPHGAHYGWLDEGDATPLVEAHRGGHLHRLDAYRGCVAYRRPAQAADYYLRRHLGEQAVDALVLDSSSAGERDAALYTARFRHRPRSTYYDVEVSERLSDADVHKSCGDAEAKPITEYAVERITALDDRSV